jgi:putative peptidoglycan lipid II flippase
MERDTQKSMTTAALVLMASTLASRALGLVREGLLAARLGTGVEADAYSTAFLLPDLVNTLLAGGFLSLSFVPLYMKALRERGQLQASRFLAAVVLFLGVCGTVAIAALWIGAEPALRLMQPGMAGTLAMEKSVHLTRILLPAQLCFLLAGAWNGVQYAHRKFLYPALAPLVYNLGILAGGWFLAPWMGAEGFAWGVLAGAVAGHLVLQAWGVGRLGARVVSPVGTLPDLKAFLWRSAPLMLGLTLGFSSEFLLRRLAGYLGTGAVAEASYAFRLMMVLVALFGQSTGVASYPFLVELAGAGEWERLQKLLNDTLRRLIAILVPVSFLVSFHAHDVVKLAFRRGRFDDDAVAAVALPLSSMVWCVFPWCVQIVLARALYARGRFWLGAALGTGCVVVSWPIWSMAVDLYGKRGVGPGLVFLVVVQALVFSGAWRRGPHGKMAFAGLGRLLPEVVLASFLACGIGRGAGSFLPPSVSGIAAGCVSVGLIATCAVFRRWPGMDAALSRLRTRFGRT